MALAKVLEVFDNLFISKDEEAVACILVFLSTKLTPYHSPDTFHFTNVVFLLINFTSAAAESKAILDSDLPSNGSVFTVSFLHVVQVVDSLLQLNAFLIQVVVVANNTCTDKHAFTCDRIGWVEANHIAGDSSLQ